MNEIDSTAAVTLADRWAMLRRRRWPAIGVGVGVLLVSIATALLWPPTYSASGTILIEQQELPSELVQSTISSYADQRIQVIGQRVMTTDNLLRIIERYDLYPRLRKFNPREEILDRMHKDVHFQMISAEVMDPRQGRATKANIAFMITYDADTPVLAARVANELVSLYLDENVKNRKRLSGNAETFLDGEADRLGKNLAELDQKVAAFRAKHLNTLPEQAIINQQMLVRSEDELRDIDTQVRALDQNATFLDAQLAVITPSSQVYTSTGERVLSPADRLKFLRTEYARLSGVYSADHPEVVRLKREIAGLEAETGQVDSSNDLQRQLEDARTHLAQIQKRYAPEHPAVVRLEQQVAALTQAIKEAPSVAPRPVERPDNPAYIQIKAQRDANTAQHDSLVEKRVSVQAKIADLEARLAVAPAVLRDYDALSRQYDSEQLKYREVRQKQMSAKLAENLEDQQMGERFTLIDPPLAPEEPASPNRALLIGLGFILALAAGLGSAILLENTDGSVRNRRDLETLLQAPPLAILPRIMTAADLAVEQRRLRLALYSTAGSLVLALVLTQVLYRPLDVLWAIAMRRLGI
jgi:succinoglycan biosynthesis transport protein ExoP